MAQSKSRYPSGLSGMVVPKRDSIKKNYLDMSMSMKRSYASVKFLNTGEEACKV